VSIIVSASTHGYLHHDRSTASSTGVADSAVVVTVVVGTAL
jgi:hypothetical protein